MMPVFFQIGSLTLYSYGVLSAAALGLAAWLAARRARRFGLTPGRAVDTVFLLFIAGIVGARLLFVLLNADLYLNMGLNVLNLRQGGLIWYGGFLTAFGFSFFLIRRLGVNPWKFGDFVAPVLAAGHAVGRIGCFLNGCCAGIGYHPVQIDEAVFLAALAFVLWKKNPDSGRPGDIFLLYAGIYAAGRFALEFFRADQTRYAYLSIPQITSIVILAAVLMAWRLRHVRRKV